MPLPKMTFSHFASISFVPSQISKVLNFAPWAKLSTEKYHGKFQSTLEWHEKVEGGFAHDKAQQLQATGDTPEQALHALDLLIQARQLILDTQREGCRHEHVTVTEFEATCGDCHCILHYDPKTRSFKP